MSRLRILTDEERKQRKLERQAKWRAEHPEYGKKYYADNNAKWDEYRQNRKQEIAEYNAKWRAEHKEERAEYKTQYMSEYNKTPIGRAAYLVNSYQKADKQYNRGECTLTAQWVVENIFSKPCHYCGETDWLKIGCDRIDNSLPHTPENVVPCCDECNKKRGRKSYEEFLNSN